MNIFALHPDPAICASYHCDQHLHKMILESAQMLSSTIAETRPELKNLLYKPTHVNHPCTLWVKKELSNALWLIDLCHELEAIRANLGRAPHKSMEIVKIVEMNLPHIGVFSRDIDFIFCGPEEIGSLPNLTVHQKYQEYYKLKRQLWLGTSAEMSYKNRPTPEFLSKS